MAFSVSSLLKPTVLIFVLAASIWLVHSSSLFNTISSSSSSSSPAAAAATTTATTTTSSSSSSVTSAAAAPVSNLHQSSPSPATEHDATANNNNSSVRGIIALYLTHIGFHGVGLLTRNLHSWTQNLIVPQRNLDLTVFFNRDNISEDVLVSRLRLDPVDKALLKKIVLSSSSENSSVEDKALRQLVSSHAVLRSFPPSEEDELAQLLHHHNFYRFCSPFAPSARNRVCVLISLVSVATKWPSYLRDPERRRHLLFERKDWLRCGCPPYCPLKRNPPEYVQGTRWYTYDIFFEAGGFVKKFYQYWVKLDVDITIFRPLPKSVNLLEKMRSSGKVFMHTGYTYNGGGCSNNLHRSILRWCNQEQAPKIAPVSAGQHWWTQDDNVYYSNFVVSSVEFHTSEKPLELARFLNEEVEEGFFKYRWTDQSLFHKVFGVFLGPQEKDFLLDMSWLRCSKKAGFHRGAIFYHSKKEKRRSELAKCTDLSARSD